MRGFEIERTLDEDTCSMETLPEKILKVRNRTCSSRYSCMSDRPV